MLNQQTPLSLRFDDHKGRILGSSHNRRYVKVGRSSNKIPSSLPPALTRWQEKAMKETGYNFLYDTPEVTL